MGKVGKFWLFGGQDEPADDFDEDYDSVYYGENDLSDDDIKKPVTSSDSLYMDGMDSGVSDVRVVSAPSAQQPTNEAVDNEAPEDDNEGAQEYLYKVTYMPQSYDDGPVIVESMIDGRVVVIDTKSLDHDSFLRVFDYVMGAAQALGCEIGRIDAKTVVIYPVGISSDDVDIDELEEEPYDEDDYEDEYSREDSDEEYENGDEYDSKNKSDYIDDGDFD